MKLIRLLPPVHNTRQERLLALLIVAGAAGVLLYLLTDNPEAPLIRTAPCLFRTLTGLYCPGCGTRSALLQLVRGNLYAAWRLNPFTILALPALVLFTVSQALTLLRGRSLPRLFLSPSLVWAIFFFILAYWILRNIPVYPFTLLQPWIVN